MYLLRYFNLDQGGGPTKRQANISIPAMQRHILPYVGMKTLLFKCCMKSIYRNQDIRPSLQEILIREYIFQPSAMFDICMPEQVSTELKGTLHLTEFRKHLDVSKKKSHLLQNTWTFLGVYH